MASSLEYVDELMVNSTPFNPLILAAASTEIELPSPRALIGATRSTESILVNLNGARTVPMVD
jgi:hypothetical protein